MKINPFTVGTLILGILSAISASHSLGTERAIYIIGTILSLGFTGILCAFDGQAEDDDDLYN